MLSIAGLVIVVLVMIWLVLQKKQKRYNDDTNETTTKQKQPRTIWLITAIALAIVGLVVFLVTEDMNNTMTIVDRWTIVNVVIFIIELIASFLHSKT